MKDLKFLAICGLVGFSLITVDHSLFIKSLGSSHFATNQMKLAAQEVKIDGFSKIESDFWNNIKEINNESKVIAQVPDTEPKIQPQPQPTPTTSTPSSKSLRQKQLVPNFRPQEKPYKSFLLVGDSIMGFLGVSFENKIKKSDYNIQKIKLEFKISSGLNRIDFYDWYSNTKKLIQQNNPDVMIVVFGGNDDQGIIDVNGKAQEELTPKWEKAYEERVERYAKLLDEYAVRKVYWIGHPISNMDRYNKFFPIFNRIYKEVSKSHPKIEFVDYWDLFAVNGKFYPIGNDNQGKRARVRYNDGIHPTEFGADMMIDILKKKMLDDGILRPKSVPEKQAKK